MKVASLRASPLVWQTSKSFPDSDYHCFWCTTILFLMPQILRKEKKQRCPGLFKPSHKLQFGLAARTRSPSRQVLVVACRFYLTLGRDESSRIAKTSWRSVDKTRFTPPFCIDYVQTNLSDFHSKIWRQYSSLTDLEKLQFFDKEKSYTETFISRFENRCVRVLT